MPAPLTLIGFMAAGKTSVGRVLAETWGLGFRDTDQDVEAAEGRSVSDIFVDSGDVASQQQIDDALATLINPTFATAADPNRIP